MQLCQSCIYIQSFIYVCISVYLSTSNFYAQAKHKIFKATLICHIGQATVQSSEIAYEIFIIANKQKIKKNTCPDPTVSDCLSGSLVQLPLFAIQMNAHIFALYALHLHTHIYEHSYTESSRITGNIFDPTRILLWPGCQKKKVCERVQ